MTDEARNAQEFKEDEEARGDLAEALLVWRQKQAEKHRRLHQTIEKALAARQGEEDPEEQPEGEEQEAD